MESVPAAWLIVAALLAGLVRGFSGFGSAMVFVPLATFAVDPASALVLLFLTDLVAAVPLVLPALKRCDWREVAPLALGASIMTPVGVWILLTLPDEPLRWGICLAVLAAVLLMAAGWRYQRRLGPVASVGVGGLSGLLGGIAGLYGPPVILLWLGASRNAISVRTNIVAFFASLTLIAGATYAANGMFTQALALQALWLVPLYGLPIWLGARAFRRSSDALFRWVGLVICGAAAIAALPLWR